MAVFRLMRIIGSCRATNQINVKWSYVRQVDLLALKSGRCGTANGSDWYWYNQAAKVARTVFLFQIAATRRRETPMTLIGALPVGGGAVLLADRQETISDYAKWDVDKIKHAELQGQYRFLMAGAGDGNTIDMLWEEVVDDWRKALPGSLGQPMNLKKLIVIAIRRLTKERILQYPSGDQPFVDLIWAIQQITPAIDSPLLFRTYGLAVNSIRRPYFSGNPIQLMQYLSDLYLNNVLMTLDEAEALAAYMLWEAKEYDPTVGKHSDVVTLRMDGTIGRLDRRQVEYWEEHFEYFKNSLRLLPLLSCSTSLSQQVYDPKDHLQRFKTAMETLRKQQLKMRVDTSGSRSTLEVELTKNLRKTAMNYLSKKAKQSAKKSPKS